MKNTDKKTVFYLAWQFARQTGLSFSECLKKAWANIKLKAKMSTQIVRFYFQKVDGQPVKRGVHYAPICYPKLSTLNAKAIILYKYISIPNATNIAVLRSSTL